MSNCYLRSNCLNKMNPNILKTIHLIIDTACIVVLSFHVLILLLWVIKLFNDSIRLRKKAKYCTLAAYNQDTYLEALNSKVEYRKSLFLFAIVVCELISSLFTIMSSIDSIINTIEIYKLMYPNGYKNETVHNATDAITNELNQLGCEKSEHFYRTLYQLNKYIVNDNWIRVPIVAFGIPINLTFSLVYTLMSYYVMVTKKSLNYNFSLKSVDLAREQKVLLLVSSAICIILLVLLVRVEMSIVFRIVESCFTIFQSFLTYRYSRKLIQVINWKKKDTEIAFGTDHFQYKLYTKSLKSLKRFVALYNTVVITFCLYVILRSLVTSMIFLNPYELFHVYGVCIPFHLSPQFFNIYKYIVETQLVIEKIPLAISLFLIFLLNLFTTPYLLSKVNLSCHCNCKRLNLKTNKNLKQPLL